MKNKILVTGGLGYIGSHTVVELYFAGFTPIIVDDMSNTSIKNLDGINKILDAKIELYKINCNDYHALTSVFVKHPDIKAAIHFAAFKSVEESITNPDKYFNNNIGSLKILLKCMNDHNINNIIFSSSCTVYGNADVLPVTEKTHFKKAESPYAETKQECERILNNQKFSSVSLRYFNPIGCHSSSLIGDCSTDSPSNLVPIIAEVASGARDLIIVNGDDYNTCDGTCVRDYIHVVDLANAHVKSLKYLFDNKGKFVFNVGTGKGHSVLEIINSFQKANKVRIHYKIGERRSGDVEEIYADTKYINDTLNWKANKTLESALNDYWNWYVNIKE